MGTLSAQRKTEIAETLRRAATWVKGPRVAVLTELADEIGGPDESTEVAEDDKPKAAIKKAAAAKKTTSGVRGQHATRKDDEVAPPVTPEPTPPDVPDVPQDDGVEPASGQQYQ